jgi:hypothetical protein
MRALINGDWRTYLRESWRNIPGDVIRSPVANPMDDSLLQSLALSCDCKVVQERTNSSAKKKRIRV